MKKIKTSIEGLDEMLEGGIPEGNAVLVSGSPGTGKTMFGLQFIYSGAVKFHESGVFVTLGEDKKQLEENAKNIGMDFDNVKEVSIIAPNPENFDVMKKKIKEEVQKMKAKRLVIDSLTILETYAPSVANIDSVCFKEEVLEGVPVFTTPVLGPEYIRRIIGDFLKDLKKLGCTMILTSELPKESNYLSRDTVSEFMCDGVIILKNVLISNENKRIIFVEKMRGTSHDRNVHTFEITNNGIIIYGTSGAK